jgi:hypothetical protein
MPAYDWPTLLRPSEQSVWLQAASMIIPVQRNPAVRQVWGTLWTAWRCDFIMGTLNPVKKKALSAFLHRLDGASGLVTITDWDYEYDQFSRGMWGGVTGAVTITGPKDSLYVAAAGVGGSGTFLAGDRFSAAGVVYEVSADVTAVGGSIAQLEIRPRLRTDLAGEPATLSNLRWTMQLENDDQVKKRINSYGNVPEGMTINFVEVTP